MNIDFFAKRMTRSALENNGNPCRPIPPISEILRPHPHLWTPSISIPLPLQHIPAAHLSLARRNYSPCDCTNVLSKCHRSNQKAAFLWQLDFRHNYLRCRCQKRPFFDRCEAPKPYKFPIADLQPASGFLKLFIKAGKTNQKW